MTVSHETEAKLKAYLALLEKWQSKINLISNSSLETAWERHFEDSLQILDFLPEGKKILFDLGSGAGFPGLVLAIGNPNLEAHLIESDQKKCSFLKAVSRETQTSVQVHNCRIEDVSHETIPDIITARALSSLKDLFIYCEKWILENPDIVLIFPKGEKAAQEMDELKGLWTFKLRTVESKTQAGANILVFSDICRM